jgi:hypothetical protein
LEQTEEYVNGQLKNKYGDAFIRGNNGRLDPTCHRFSFNNSTLASVVYLRSQIETRHYTGVIILNDFETQSRLKTLMLTAIRSA